MIISDLSYLNEVAEECVSGASSYKPDFSYVKELKANIKINVDQDVDVKGAFNEVSFDLTAAGGYGSGTEVVAIQVAAYDKGIYLSANQGTISSFAR